MTLALIFFKNYWKQLTIIALIFTICYTGYYKIKSIGYSEANYECSIKMNEFNNSLDKLIVVIQDSSSSLIKESVESKISLKKDISTILSTIKNKPLYVIEHGKCAPSTEFIDTYNQIVDRVNK